MYRSVMSSSKQNLLSNMSVDLQRQDLSVTDSVSPWTKQQQKKRGRKPLLYWHKHNCIVNKVVEISLITHCSMCCRTTHNLATRSVVEGHHVQNLLFLDECAVALDPTGTKGRGPCRNTGVAQTVNTIHIITFSIASRRSIKKDIRNDNVWKHVEPLKKNNNTNNIIKSNASYVTAAWKCIWTPVIILFILKRDEDN